MICQSSLKVGFYRLFKVRRKSNWFLKGSGDLNFDLDRIEIGNPSAEDIILKFHWIKTLRTNSEISIKPVYIKDDPIPFIKITGIPENTKEILIYNGPL